MSTSEAARSAMRHPPQFGQKPREAVGQNAAHEELAELLVDERGKTVSVAMARGFSEEGLVDDGVEDGDLGIMGLIRAVGRLHVWG